MVDIADGRRLGIEMGETGITDRNMLAFRREHPSVVVHKHAANEETRTGADCEWWLETPHGWLCLVFQAKVLGADLPILRHSFLPQQQMPALPRHCWS